jgi:hypothetical protein
VKNINIIFLLISIFSTSCTLNHRDYDSTIYAAIQNYLSKQYVKSANYYKLALEISNTNVEDVYNAACSCALSDNSDAAFGVSNTDEVCLKQFLNY